jgi:hypothetical protein
MLLEPCLSADVRNSYSVKGAWIPVGEEARSSSGNGGRGRWQFNAGGGDDGTVSKLGFRGRRW